MSSWNRSSSRAASSAWDSERSRAAASSIASGSPSRRRQTWSTRLGVEVRALQSGDGGHRPRHVELGGLAVQPQGRDGEDQLPRHRQRLAARREDADGGTRPQHALDERRDSLDEVLAVVEQQQDLVRPQPLGDRLLDRFPRSLTEAQHLGQLSGNARLVGDSGQVDEPHAVAEGLQQTSGCLQRQPRLAAAARTRERHEPMVGEPRHDRGQLRLAPHEVVEAHRQVGRHRRQRSQRRERCRQAVTEELEDRHRVLQVLEPVLAQLADGCVGRECAAGSRHQYLPAVPSGAHSRGDVQGHAVVALAHPPDVAGVHGHAHPHETTLGPRMCGQVALSVVGCGDRVGRRGEDGEDGVPLRLEHRAVMVGDGVLQDAPMGLDQVVVAGTPRLEQPRRSLNVGEQEGDGAAREVHVSPRATTARAGCCPGPAARSPTRSACRRSA